MKRLLIWLSVLALAVGLTACGGTQPASYEDAAQPAPESAQKAPESGRPAAEQSAGETSPADQSADSAPAAPDAGEGEAAGAEGTRDVLVAYFSATGNTRGIAQHLQALLDADLYEIVPEAPYTEEDLNYSDDDCRANQEQNDPSARPAISDPLENPADYRVVFLGYPIWWGQAPKILYTFLESCDFGDATIVPFCTSGSSGIGASAEDLQPLAPDANWLPGQRFSGGASEDTVAAWVEGLELSEAAAGA